MNYIFGYIFFLNALIIVLAAVFLICFFSTSLLLSGSFSLYFSTILLYFTNLSCFLCHITNLKKNGFSHHILVQICQAPSLKNSLYLCIKIKPVTAGADVILFDWLLFAHVQYVWSRKPDINRCVNPNRDRLGFYAKI